MNETLTNLALSIIAALFATGGMILLIGIAGATITFIVGLKGRAFRRKDNTSGQ